MILVVSRSESLRRATAAAQLAAHWATETETLEEGLSLEPSTVLVDLNLEPAEFSLEAITRSKRSDLDVVAFLGQPAGRQAILASLAGADRVISEEQLLDELPSL
jgi:hypothetical protein